jgi:hypothetical protein
MAAYSGRAGPRIPVIVATIPVDVTDIPCVLGIIGHDDGIGGILYGNAQL